MYCSCRVVNDSNFFCRIKVRAVKERFHLSGYIQQYKRGKILNETEKNK